MVRVSHILVVSCALFAAVHARPLGAIPQPNIKELRTEQYLGRWYNLYANSVEDRIFDGVTCIIADYGVVPGRSDAISLINSSQNKTTFLPYSTRGFATQSPNASEPGDFVVAQSVPGYRPAPKEPPVYVKANYVIMELGPVVDGAYDYSLISDGGNSKGLFVLARDKNRFVEKYQQEVLKKLATWGFTGALAPYVTAQNNCTYPPPPPAYA
ncbi:hypothetical protein CYMTET_15676 [Cymbomonas tetramitiformis]|uniref:Lipocalin/cytosolic fatty-acid binding domain-containing protein n=1 Tax=Cymbomonas tetramitiformis TaxID=36881 RepID=A0AAE0C7N9_9CHLO|nr:hypothetical protein CYMTET_41352 [Cymbomonas tetramitiformis]KAK3276237.1 hypothetical protein CYMTET_15676 [Cymbomonas tetramitiformis]